MASNAPSPIGAVALAPAHSAALQALLDLIYEGFYALFILKNGSGPRNDADFAQKMTPFLDEFGGGFRPYAERPDQIIHKRRSYSDLPWWVLAAVLGLVSGLMCILGYIALRGSLARTAEHTMSAYNDVVKLAPKAANLTITLP